MAKSIMQQEKRCYVTGYEGCGLDKHHCIHGIANRKLAEKYGLTVYLRHDVHMALHAKQKPFSELDERLKREAQEAFERVNPNGAEDPREDFLRVFGRNYL